MKRIIYSIATALLLTTTFSAYAAAPSNPLKNKSSLNIIETYLESTTLGNDQFNKYLFSKDFEYHIASTDVSKYNKRQYFKFLEENKNLKYNCSTTYEILEENAEQCTAKATMKFENFTRVDYITLKNNRDIWQVNKVVTTYL